MTQLLHLDASPRGSRSLSRALSAKVVASLAAADPTTSVVYRDLGRGGVPFIDEAWIAAAFSDPADRSPELQDAIRISDELVDEGLAGGKKVYVVSARGAGGYRAGEAMAAMDYEAAYLRAVFGLIGITDVTVVDIENATGAEDVVQASLADARRRIAQLLAA